MVKGEGMSSFIKKIEKRNNAVVKTEDPILGDLISIVLAMPISKKIIVDQCVHELIPELKKSNIEHVWGIEKLGFDPNQSTDDTEIARKLTISGQKTPQSQYLFITNNEEHFKKPKGYDILIVPQATNEDIIATIKGWLTYTVITKKADNKIWRMYKKQSKYHHGYIITDKIISQPKRK